MIFIPEIATICIFSNTVKQRHYCMKFRKKYETTSKMNIARLLRGNDLHPNNDKKRRRPVKRYLEFVISGLKDRRFAARTHGYERSWEKTKNDDSEVGGEKNLVDDTRFLRRWVLRHCLFLFRFAVLSLSLLLTHLLC